MKKLMKVAAVLMALCLLLTGCEALSVELPFELPFELPENPIIHVHKWQEATCAAPMTCECGATKGEPLEHTIVNVEGKEATCTETGLTLSKVCSVCGYVQRPQVVIPANGHTPGDPANCTNDQTCTECGIVLQESTGGVHVGGAAATCTTAQTCTFCDAVMEPAKGHTTKNGTCETCGVTVYTTYINSKIYSAAETKNLDGIDWTLDAHWGAKDDSSKNGHTFKDPGTDPVKQWRGQQFGAGSASAHMDWMVLSSTELTGITRIRIRAQGVSGFVGTITVTVGGTVDNLGQVTGGTVVLDKAELFDDPDSTYKQIAAAEGADDYFYFDIQLDESLSGAIHIRVSQPDTEKAFYIGAINVDYAG